jgi:hypothetical protein
MTDPSGEESARPGAKKRRWGCLIISSLPLIALSAAILQSGQCSFVYFGSSLNGRVTHANTGQPLPDVVVVALWETNMLSFGSPAPGVTLHADTAVTGADGTFHIPWWGPRFTLPMYWPKPGRSPEMCFIKSGFVFVSAYRTARGIFLHLSADDNIISLYKERTSPINADFGGLNITMDEFYGTPDDRGENVGGVTDCGFYSREAYVELMKEYDLISRKYRELYLDGLKFHRGKTYGHDIE